MLVLRPKTKYQNVEQPTSEKHCFQAAKAGIRSTKKVPVNPLLHSYYSRKVAEGKPKMVALSYGK